MTIRQIELFLSALEQVCQSGYGEVCFVITNGTIVRIRVTFSLPFSPAGRSTR